MLDTTYSLGGNDSGLSFHAGFSWRPQSQTPVYASPEQIQGHSVDARSDLYSLGIVTFEMVTGRRPFNIDSIKGVERQHLEVTPPSPAELRPGIPQVLSDIILRCLEKDPAERFQTAAELGDALSSLELERIG